MLDLGSKIHNLFPTKIYSDRVGNYDEIQEELKGVIQVFDTEIGWEDLWDTHLITDSKFQDNIIDQHNLTKFKDEITYHIREYSAIDNEFKINSSWLTRCDKGNYAVCHEHGWSDISGVYYYQSNGKDGDIYFQTPNLAQTTCIWMHDPNTIQFPPEQGGLILFPGWLRHGVNTNTTDHTRISISFNISFIRS